MRRHLLSSQIADSRYRHSWGSTSFRRPKFWKLIRASALKARDSLAFFEKGTALRSIAQNTAGTRFATTALAPPSLVQGDTSWRRSGLAKKISLSAVRTLSQGELPLKRVGSK
jgi:hypothetical protein